MSKTAKTWDWEINDKTSDWSWNLSELFSYRHLLFSLIRREFLLNYQQTLLGPVWIIFQPIITLITYVLVFGKVVRISTGSIPHVLFFFAGIVLWNFFNDSFGGTSNTFRNNLQVFSKVYFPRIIMPVSAVSTHFLRCLMQLLLLFIIIAYHVIYLDFKLAAPALIPAFLISVIMVGIISLSMGMIFSVLTAKYRDIGNLVTLFIRLLMYVTPVIYPLASVPKQFSWIVLLNPLTPLFELFRLSLLGEGTVSLPHLAYSFVFMIVILPVSLLLFNRNGNKLIDVI
jgi:lipopolysaccharide transport system permease protein